MADKEADKELETYISEKQEGRRVHEGKAHPVEDSGRRTAQDLAAARAGTRSGEHDVPPDAEGQDRAGHIEQTTTSDGFTQSR
jgi:hypothetical protein